MKTPWDYEITNTSLPPIIDATEFDAITGGVMSSTTEQKTKKLEGVSSAIRDYCGWHVSPSRTCVFTGNGEGRLLVLPAMAVTAVEYVRIDGEDAEFEWMSNGLVRLKSGRFPDSWRSVECRYTAGYDSASVLGEIVAQIASNALAAAPRSSIAIRRCLRLTSWLGRGSHDAELGAGYRDNLPCARR